MFGTRLINSSSYCNDDYFCIDYDCIIYSFYKGYRKKYCKYNCNYIGDKYAYSYDWYQDI